MPRAQKRGLGALDVSAADIVALARNPDHFDQMITKLAEARDASHKASSELRKTQESFDQDRGNDNAARKASEEALERQRVKIQRDHENEERKLSGDRDWIVKEKDKLEKRRVELVELHATIQVADVRIQKELEVLNARGGKLANQAEEQTAFNAELIAREANLEEREDSLDDRESLLKNRVAGLAQDLESS